MASCRLFAGLIAVSLSQAAFAECESWKIDGNYTFEQSNGVIVSANLQQNGNRLTGEARFYSTAIKAFVGGPLQGFIDGDGFRFRVSWFQLRQDCTMLLGAPVHCREKIYDETGVYEGAINANGEIDGFNFPFQRAHARTNFFTRETARCADIAMLPPSAILSIGKKRADAGNPTGSIPPPPNRRSPIVMIPDAAIPRTPDPATGRAPPSSAIEVGYWQCRPGLHERKVSPMDKGVCVDFMELIRLGEESAQSTKHWVDGAYGPHTCRSGLVWREAAPDDDVCVTPERRAQVQVQNQQR